MILYAIRLLVIWQNVIKAMKFASRGMNIIIWLDVMVVRWQNYSSDSDVNLCVPAERTAIQEVHLDFAYLFVTVLGHNDV